MIKEPINKIISRLKRTQLPFLIEIKEVKEKEARDFNC